ncbi:hypothetical protein BLNAU_18939 [Blattamonas nauphoetae]|uniref:Uncharacterized protein n=1 Tax=Blattamonas nauphoetae TaxID=2049346 RepID=A0ABQ9X374_9EUKA|nr:hypothetical protein BLNAU_18939 [Blattamonas nauphoetae]
MGTVNSYNTPTALLKTLNEVADLLFSTVPSTDPITSTSRTVSSLEMSTIDMLQTAATHAPNNLSPFEQPIRTKRRTAEGEERWRFVTQLAVVSKSDFAFADELTKAENDAQALFILSLHSIRSTPRLDFHLESNLDAFDRVVEFKFDSVAISDEIRVVRRTVVEQAVQLDNPSTFGMKSNFRLIFLFIYFSFPIFPFHYCFIHLFQQIFW